MNTSAFDPQSFLDATQTEVNERRNPLPVENPASPDGCYVAVIGEVKMESGMIEKGEKAGQPWLSAVIPLKIDVPAQLQEGLKLPPTLTITDRAFIDLTPNKTIDNSPGKNRRQKDYREALDLNKPGDAFSWRMVTGKPVKVKITHELYQEVIQERIAHIFKM